MYLALIKNKYHWLIFLLFSVCNVVFNTALAEKKAADVRKINNQIQVLATALDKESGEAGELQAELRRLEKSIGEKAQKQHQIQKKIKAANRQLEQTKQQAKQLEVRLEAQKIALAQQLQALYTAGEQSHLRLLLKQDEPADIGRTMQYFEYLNRSRVGKIRHIRKTLTELSDMQQRIRQDKKHLTQLKKRLLTQKSQLKTTAEKRSAVLKGVQKNIRETKSKIKRLKADERRLQNVVNKLVKELPRVRPSFTPDKPFSKLKYRLSWPTKGTIIANYGQKRNEKQRWRGTLIAASAGQKVQAVAKGRVVFSGWMNGYGHLIIIEHDKNYMSLYGYNRTLYKKEGQTVNGGDMIAAVGNSGGQKRAALYFEIRKGKSPQNPAKWCR